MKVVSLDRRKRILWLQWLPVIGITFLLILNAPDAYSSLAAAIIVGFLLANLVPPFLPYHCFQSQALYYVLIVGNIFFISTAIFLTGEARSELYAFFFLILLIATIGRSLVRLLISSLAISLLYLWMLYHSGQPVFEGGFLVRILFLFIVGLFFGYLAYLLKTERLPVEGDFTVELFEFGKTLAQAPDLESLHIQIPTLVSPIMGADTCELAIIEEQRIKRRIFQDPSRHDVPLLYINRSIHEKAHSSDKTYVSTGFKKDLSFIKKEDFSFYPYREYMAKSWKTHTQLSGVLAVYRKAKPWESRDEKRFQLLVGQAVLALENARLLQELESQARTDGLTGLANHRYFYDRLEEELSRAERQKYPLSIIMIDVDHLKSVNDTRGHRVGDEVLRRVARLLNTITRRMDTAARYGGDEFAMVLPETSPDQSHSLSSRILKEIKSLKFEEVSEISVSIGTATFPTDGDTITSLIENADQALYFAKAEGGARTYRYSRRLGEPPQAPSEQ